jgi:hypothetical protein
MAQAQKGAGAEIRAQRDGYRVPEENENTWIPGR